MQKTQQGLLMLAGKLQRTCTPTSASIHSIKQPVLLCFGVDLNLRLFSLLAARARALTYVAFALATVADCARVHRSSHLARAC